MSAQRAIVEGGFNESAKNDGGFRRNVRNSEAQQALSDAESLAGGASAERNLERAKLEFEENPDSPEAVNKYAQLLRRIDSRESDALALKVYLMGYKTTGQYRFRMNAGDIKMGRMRKKIKTLQVQAGEGNSSEALDTLRKEFLDVRSSEYSERVTKYPTDRGIRFELGLIEFERKNFENAMGAFQQCKDEAKFRTRATDKLESAEKERELPIRYDLMNSLIDLARENQAPEEAREAAEICSAILRKDIGYRDIRSRRKAVDELIKELEG